MPTAHPDCEQIALLPPSLPVNPPTSPPPPSPPFALLLLEFTAAVYHSMSPTLFLVYVLAALLPVPVFAYKLSGVIGRLAVTRSC